MYVSLLQPAVRAYSVDCDEEEADKRQNEGYVYSWMTGYSNHIYDTALQRGHDGAAYDGHNKEGRSKGGVLAVYVLKGYAIDGGEHQ